MSSLSHTYQPLDYSYQHITDITQLLTCEPHNDSQSDLIQQTKQQLNKLKQLQVDQENQIPAVLRTLNAIRTAKAAESDTTQPQSPTHAPQSPTEASKQANNTAAAGAAGDVAMYKREPVITHGIKLSYNSLTTIAGIHTYIDQLIYRSAQQLKFIDLSFNKLHAIESDLLIYTNCTVLYLQGNNITQFTDIFKLRPPASSGKTTTDRQSTVQC